MRIEQSVEVDAPVQQVWDFVSDVPQVAPCMPGAKLTKVVDEKTYEGTVVVKLGPIRMTYKGTVVVDEMNDADHTARMSANGRDVKGAGTARAQVEAKLEPVSDTVTRINVGSDVQLTGKVASFGRGAVQDVANRLFGQFASNLRDALHNQGNGHGGGESGEQATAAATGTAATAAGTQTSPATGTAATQTAPSEPGATGAPTNPPAAKPAARPSAPTAADPKPLEAGGLIGTVVTGRAKAFAETFGAFARGLRIRLRERR